MKTNKKEDNISDSKHIGRRKYQVLCTFRGEREREIEGGGSNWLIDGCYTTCMFKAIILK